MNISICANDKHFYFAKIRKLFPRIKSAIKETYNLLLPARFNKNLHSNIVHKLHIARSSSSFDIACSTSDSNTNKYLAFKVAMTLCFDNILACRLFVEQKTSMALKKVDC